MKYIPALLITSMFSLSAYAQNGFYIAPSIGAGISNATKSPYAVGVYGYAASNHKSAVFSNNLQFGIGYRYKNWLFQTGIQYFKSGYKIDNLVFGTDFDPNNDNISGSGSYTIKINQIGIPLQVGYAIPLSNKLSLVPYVGVLSSFTFSGSSKLNEPGKLPKNSELSGAALNDYGRFTFWGLAGAQLEYKLSDKVSLFGGPSIQYKLGSTSNNNQQNFYNLNFNLGLKMNLKKKGN
jgi:hypothetical protein